MQQWNDEPGAERTDQQKLTLLLLYLNAWDENEDTGGKPLLRSWSNFDFEDLDALSNQQLIKSKKGNKSVYLTEQGRQRARELMRELLGKET